MRTRYAARILFVLGVLCLGQASWIHAKALVAQVLLRRAWAETQRGAQTARPWPWADTWPVARLRSEQHGVDLIVLEGATGEATAFAPGAGRRHRPAGPRRQCGHRRASRHPFRISGGDRTRRCDAAHGTRCGRAALRGRRGSRRPRKRHERARAYGVIDADSRDLLPVPCRRSGGTAASGGSGRGALAARAVRNKTTADSRQPRRHGRHGERLAPISRYPDRGQFLPHVTATRRGPDSGGRSLHRRRPRRARRRGSRRGGSCRPRRIEHAENGRQPYRLGREHHPPRSEGTRQSDADDDQPEVPPDLRERRRGSASRSPAPHRWTPNGSARRDGTLDARRRRLCPRRRDHLGRPALRPHRRSGVRGSRGGRLCRRGGGLRGCGPRSRRHGLAGLGRDLAGRFDASPRAQRLPSRPWG